MIKLNQEPYFSLQTDQRIARPDEIVEGYIKREHRARRYDEAPVPTDDLLTEERITLINDIGGGRFPRIAIEELMKRREEVKEKLSKIPKEVSLLDDSIPWDAVEQLFAVFLVPKIARFWRSRTSKVLHKFRPRLIPILDNKRVVDYYCERAAYRIGEQLPPAGAQEAQKSIACMKILKTDADNNSDLLQSLADENQRTPVRILDILLYELTIEPKTAWRGP